MGAECAVCRQPITKQSRFRIVGTEAIHDICITRLSESLVTRLRQRAAELGGAVDRAVIEIKRLRDENLDVHRQNERLRRDIEDLRVVLKQRQFDIDTLQGQLREYATVTARAVTDRDAARRERDTARSDRDAARSELALHQTLEQRSAVTVRATTDPPAPAQDDQRDSTEVRFSLLELDKP